MRMNLTRDFYIPKGANEVKPDDISAVAYTYETNGIAYGLGFHGKAQKPDWHYRFRSPEARAKHIDGFFANIRGHDKVKADRKAQRKAFINPFSLGDILHYSWGYDQTNCEFYQVVAINDKQITMREIGQDSVDGSTYAHGMADSRIATPDRFIGEPLTKLVQTYDGAIAYVSMKFGSASLWSGEPMYCSWYA